MGLRYVWSKWNAQVESGVNKTPVSYLSVEARGYYTGYSVQPSGSITLTGYVSASSSDKGVKGYFSIGGNTYEGTVSSVGLDYGTSSWVITGLSDISKLTGYYRVVKGSTGYGNVSSENSGAYPANGASGSYWYVSLGSDTIDPTALSYTDPVKAGGTVNLTITTSSGIVHGGTVTYTIQTTTNGEDYYDAGTTTGTTFAVTVPQDAAIWNVRVYAKDDTGFVSSTYVYGNNVPTWVTVIQSEIVPASGDLGYLTSKNIVALGVSNPNETTYSISANLNGSPCFSVSDVPIDTATFITLEDETWESIPQETEQTLDVIITFTSSTDTRNYTFKKFTYDDASLEGVMEGTARAIRIKREYQTQILGKNLPKEIIKLDNPINSSGLKEATASEAQVFKGYTFFAGDSELREGTALSTPTTATAADIVSGKTAYNDLGQILTGSGIGKIKSGTIRSGSTIPCDGRIVMATLLISNGSAATVTPSVTNCSIANNAQQIGRLLLLNGNSIQWYEGTVSQAYTSASYWIVYKD